MHHYLFPLATLLSLMISFYLCATIGRKIGAGHLTEGLKHKLKVVSVAEGAVFALLGLMIAFTFSGSYDRFEHRKTHIIDEANAYMAAYHAIDVLNPKFQVSLKNDLLQFVVLHYDYYSAIPYPDQIKAIQNNLDALESRLWKEAVTGVMATPRDGVMILVLPAFTRVFDTAFAGIEITKIHPPLAIFALLIGLAMLGAFLTGYSTAIKRTERALHTYCYIILTALTIYLIIELEMPRSGMIRISEFDRILMTVVQKLSSSTSLDLKS